MGKMLVLLSIALAIQPALAKENWPLSVRVLSTKNIENPRGTFHLAWGGGSGGAGWTHRIAEHVFVEATDGNSYELVPQNRKDMLLPGTFQAKIEKRDMRVCEPKDNGSCREVKFNIVSALPTSKDTELVTKSVDPVSAAVAVPGTSTTAQATLFIESTPVGADIEIDGAFVGNTPSTVNVTAGSHDIAVKKKGFAGWTKKLNVTGGSIRLNAELEATPQ